MSNINYQSEVVLTEGVKLDIGWLPRGSRIAPSYTLTATSAAPIGAEELLVTSNIDNLFIQAGTILPFGLSRAVVLTDTFVDATTPTELPVRELRTAIAANATARTLALLTVLGLTEASPNAETQTEDTTNFLSGFGQENVVVGANRTVQCSGNIIVGDRAMDTILKPMILEDDKVRGEIWAELVMPSGEKFEGAAKISNFSSSVSLRSIQKFSFSLMFQGLSFRHTAATEYVATAQDSVPTFGL